MSIKVLSNKSLTCANTNVAPAIMVFILPLIYYGKPFVFNKVSHKAIILLSGVKSSCVTLEVRRLSKSIFCSVFDSYWIAEMSLIINKWQSLSLKIRL